MRPGISIEDLPKIDLIVISHNHYDHLDRLTLEKIYQKQSDHPPKIFVPLRLKKWFEEINYLLNSTTTFRICFVDPLKPIDQVSVSLTLHRILKNIWHFPELDRTSCG